MKRYFSWLFLASLPVSLQAYPPPEPGAGVIEREIEQEYRAKPLEFEKQVPSVEVDIPEEKLLLPSKKRVLVRWIEIEGNEAVSCEEILSWLTECSEQTLTISDIYEICKKIDQKYAEKGYFLARAYPPPQEIRDGILILRILEGRLGNIRIEGNKHYSTQFICRYFSQFCKRALQYDEFLKSLLLLNENADLSAGVLFEKGKKVGTADLIVRVSDNRPLHLYLNENNYGRNLTTNSQLGGRFNYGNFPVEGGMLGVTEVVGFPVNALYFTDLTYRFPVNARGTFLELAYLFSHFRIEELTTLRLKGRSLIGTFKATHALMRTRTIGIDLFGYFDYKQIQNFVLGQRTSYDRLRVLTVGTLFDHYNSGRGRDHLNFQVAFGIPGFLGGMGSVSSQASSIGGGNRFVQLNLDYDRIQQVYKEYMIYLHISGQWSPNPLTLPQQLYIGGSTTVRGYLLSVGLGDSGYYANLELRIPPPFLAEKNFFWLKKKWKDAVQILGFLDTGGTVFNRGLGSSTYITGAGFGLRVLGPISLSIDVGYPLNRSDLSSGAVTYLKLTGQPF